MNVNCSKALFNFFSNFQISTAKHKKNVTCVRILSKSIAKNLKLKLVNQMGGNKIDNNFRNHHSPSESWLTSAVSEIPELYS